MPLSPETIDGLLRVASLLEALPEARFDLRRWYQRHPCGTTYCAMGYAACSPWFQQRGFTLNKAYGSVQYIDAAGNEFDGYPAVARFFALTREEAEYLFMDGWYAPQNAGKRYSDPDLDLSCGWQPRKEEVIERIRAFVATDGQMWAKPADAAPEPVTPGEPACTPGGAARAPVSAA